MGKYLRVGVDKSCREALKYPSYTRKPGSRASIFAKKSHALAAIVLVSITGNTRLFERFGRELKRSRAQAVERHAPRKGYDMQCVFEKAVMADVDAVMENIRGVREAGLTDWDEEYPAPEHIAEDVANGALYLLRTQEGAVVASIAAYFDDAEFETDCAGVGFAGAVHSYALFRLCVRADLQGQGLGFRLVSHIIEQAKSLGCDFVRLLASETNIPANRLYEKLGFRLLGKVRLYEWDFVAYEKQLKISC